MDHLQKIENESISIIREAFNSVARLGRLWSIGDTLDGPVGARLGNVAAAETPAPIDWFTGLSGAGKSTVAEGLAARLRRRGVPVSVLDGDVLRRGINADLGFSREDRAESVRRTGEVAALISDAGAVAVAALISPYAFDRDRVRALRPARFHEVYIEADVDTCRARDPKGLYRKADAGEIAEFTGISAPYEPPSDPELVLDTRALTPDQCADRLEAYVLDLVDQRRKEPAIAGGA